MSAYPTVEDCKPGLWAGLRNGWIVGPIISTEFDGIGVYAKYCETGEHDSGTWQLDVAGQLDVDIQSPRFVVAVGCQAALVGYPI